MSVSSTPIILCHVPVCVVRLSNRDEARCGTIGKPNRRCTWIRIGHRPCGVGMQNQCLVGTASRKAPANGWLADTSRTASRGPTAVPDYRCYVLIHSMINVRWLTLDSGFREVCYAVR